MGIESYIMSKMLAERIANGIDHLNLIRRVWEQLDAADFRDARNNLQSASDAIRQQLRRDARTELAEWLTQKGV